MSLYLHRFSASGWKQLVPQVRDFASAQRTELLWVVLGSGATILAADRLLASIDLPYVVTVQDLPEYLAANQHWNPLIRRSVMTSFERVISGAKGVGVASFAMARLFAEKYGKKGIVQIHGIHPALVRQPLVGTRRSSNFLIAFAGSLYAKEEWNALLKALAHRGGQIGGRPVRIRFIGRFPLLGARKPAFVDDLGICSLRRTLELLDDADVAYLPYWFDRRYAQVAKTSFPNKISAYLAAGVPVLFHGPSDASPVAFFQRYPVGPLCHSLDPEEIAKALESVEDSRQVAARACQEAIHDELSLEIFVSRFAQLLGVNRSALLPLRVPDGSY